MGLGGAGGFVGLGVSVGTGVSVGMGVFVGTGVFVGVGVSVGIGVLVNVGCGVFVGGTAAATFCPPREPPVNTRHTAQPNDVDRTMADRIKMIIICLDLMRIQYLSLYFLSKRIRAARACSFL